MRVTYVGPLGEVEIGDTGQVVAAGESVDVDSDLGARLLEQPGNWSSRAGGSAGPAKSASKDEWVAFAVSKGADPADAEASTKDELIETYGG